MKILLYTDNHFCQYSSILRKQGEKYSLRLENQIASLNWAENLAKTENCSLVCTLGDFFDKETLNSSEISALKEIIWSEIPHYMLVGNHEMGRQDLYYNSAEVFSLIPQCKVVSTAVSMKLNDFTEVCFLPYVLETNRKPLDEYFPKQFPGIKRIILSHNDIRGMQMGPFISKTGFGIDEIEDNCDLCLNGHLHNGDRVSKKIINLGNLTGMNFSEDALQYDHCAFVLDTDTLKLACYENPFAFNFYKLDVTDNINKLNKLTLKSNAVCTIKCKARDAEKVKEFIAATNAVIDSRVIVEPEIGTVDIEESIDMLSVDHIQRFKDYILQVLGNSEIVLQELQEVSK